MYININFVLISYYFYNMEYNSTLLALHTNSLFPTFIQPVYLLLLPQISLRLISNHFLSWLTKTDPMIRGHLCDCGLGAVY